MSVKIYLRGREIEMEEVSALRAVRADQMVSQNREARNAMMALSSAAQDVTTSEIPENSRRIFEAAGWVFAPNQETTLEAARLLTSESPESVVRPVLRGANGELFVASTQLTVRFKPRRQLSSIVDSLRDQGLRIRRALGFAKNLFEVSVSSGESLTAAGEMRGETGVEYAEPQLIRHLGGRVRPTDPKYPLQWQWNNNGSSGGIAQADIRAENAWDRTLGRGARVAVIDNGMDVAHPDLQPGISGGGYFEETDSNTAVLIPYQVGDKNFPSGNHGTFCMGMVGARLGNNLGGVGGAPECILIPIACAVDQITTQATLARAVAYAANPTLEDGNASPDQGADVISCSLGPSSGAHWEMESVLMDALDYAVQHGRGGKGCPIFWAVSNGNVRIEHDEVCSYENTIAVGRSTRLDLEDGSGHGPELDFLAPGVEVYSTKTRGRYGSSTGTSFATPCAASVGALALAVRPNLTWKELRDRLRETCDKIGGVKYVGKEFGGRHDRYGYGRVNAEAAVAP